MRVLRFPISRYATTLCSAHVRTQYQDSFATELLSLYRTKAEIDVSCIICAGEGCRVCKDTGWLEILGSGMVHPNLKASGYDPQKVAGLLLAWGLSVWPC